MAPLKGRRFHAILSNPPYIPDADIEGLSEEVKGAEPRLALAGGADGLAFYRRLVSEVPDYLTEDGFLAMELGIHQAEPVRQLLEADGRLRHIELRKDLAGIERVIVAEMRSSGGCFGHES